MQAKFCDFMSKYTVHEAKCNLQTKIFPSIWTGILFVDYALLYLTAGTYGFKQNNA